MKKLKPCIALRKNTLEIWGHSRNVEKSRLWLVFSTFPLCSQMLIVFYHSVIHGLDFFINYYKYIEFFWRGAGNRGQNGVPVVKITAGLASISWSPDHQLTWRVSWRFDIVLFSRHYFRYIVSVDAGTALHRDQWERLAATSSRTNFLKLLLWLAVNDSMTVNQYAADRSL